MEIIIDLPIGFPIPINNIISLLSHTRTQGMLEKGLSVLFRQEEKICLKCLLRNKMSVEVCVCVIEHTHTGYVRERPLSSLQTRYLIAR